jgi:hypothetical protein
VGIPKNAEDFAYQAVQMGELEIDREGRIWRVANRRFWRWIGRTTTQPCARKRAERGTTYLTVRVMIDYKRVTALSHRLVWRHFRGSIPAGMTINHKNGQKQDNRPSNLELATHSEQMQHARRVLGYRAEKNLPCRG